MPDCRNIRQALAYSNVSPASRVATVDRTELSSFNGPE
jgi:hypothetical protein